MRTKGSKNITYFGDCESIPTSSTANVKHLKELATGNPLKQFKGLLRHQSNFLKWVKTRHNLIVKYEKQNRKLQKTAPKKGPTGAKTETFNKYYWYAEHPILLESINAFETFYKSTFTKLGELLPPYVQPDSDRKVSISARLLWGITGETVLSAIVPTLVFEHQLFHDLDEVDRSTDMLIGKRQYNRKSKNKTKDIEARVKAIQGIFQIRHTLSHNCGFVTKSDFFKFKELEYEIRQSEVIDPQKDNLSDGIFKELEKEAQAFTDWLRKETADFLCSCVRNRNLSVNVAMKARLEGLLGEGGCWATVKWT